MLHLRVGVADHLYPLIGTAARRSPLPRERFSPLAQNGRGAMSDLSPLCGQERTSAISLGMLTLPMILRTRSRTSVMVSGNEGGSGMGPSSYAVS